MATVIKSEKFSTKVATEKGSRHYPHAFVKATHHNVKGKAGARTSVIRYKGEWYNCSENPNKAGSFIAGTKAKAGEVPKDIAKAPAKSPKGNAAAKVTKSPAKAKKSKSTKGAKASKTAKETDSRKSRAA